MCARSKSYNHRKDKEKITLAIKGAASRGNTFGRLGLKLYKNVGLFLKDIKKTKSGNVGKQCKNLLEFGIYAEYVIHI